MKKHKFFPIFDKIVIICTSFLLIIMTGWLTIVPITCSKSYYNKQFERADTLNNLEYRYIDPDKGYQVTTYTSENLDEIISTIIDYLMDKKENMQVVINEKNVFSNQALKHMADVKILYKTGITICYFLLVIFILNIIYLIYRYRYLKKDILKYSLFSLGILLLFVLGLGLWMIKDFDEAFVFFHKVIFPDPAKFNDAFFGHTSNYSELPYIDNQLLIKVLNENVFMDAGFIILGALLLTYSLWIAFGIISKKNYYKMLK